VNYLEQDTDVVLATQKVVNGQTFATDVTENAIDINGYEVVGLTSATITIAVEDNVINFYYVRVIFTVIYAPGDHGAFDEVTHTDLYLNDPTPDAPMTPGVLGWEFDGWSPKRFATVTEDITYTAQWKQIEYTIKFLLGDETKGASLDGQTEFTLHYGDVMPTPPHPYAQFGYKFIGWKGSDGSFIVAPDDKNPTILTGYPSTVTGSVTYTAQWELVNPKQTFPDKISSEQHFDQWWADYGILCVSSSTTANGNYEVYFADWFFDRHESCTISFGANANKFDYEIVFTKGGATAYRYVNGKPVLAEDLVIPGPGSFTVIRDGMHYTKQKAFNYGADDNDSGKLLGYQFVNPFGSGAKLAWLGP
jgi:uncharacterized repeat protein (TIGR02543 family)